MGSDGLSEPVLVKITQYLKKTPVKESTPTPQYDIFEDRAHRKLTEVK